jgi:polar amino acid transport system substrate-binding protein
MLKLMMRCALLLVALMTFAGAATAQPPPNEFRVVTRVLPPMVEQQDGVLTGFSIDLWNAIAARLKVKTAFQVAADVPALFDLIRDGKADLGISALSITAAREAEFDFSQPMFNAGLQILVKGKDIGGPVSPLREIMGLLFSKTMLVWLGVALIMIIVPAHVVWLLELRHPSGIMTTRSYFPGIFQGMFWAASTLATQSEQMPRHWLARAVAVIWMFVGVVFVAFYTAQLSASLTAQKIQGAISGPEDLGGKRVAATAGSTAAAALRDLNAKVVEVERIEEAYAALDDNKVDAVVFDAPVLLYYAAHDGKGRVHAIGETFRKEDYGIVFATGNPLQKRVNNALLGLREDGSYQKIYDKWFAK